MVTAERVRELLNYDPETGVFTWNAGQRGGFVAGSEHGDGSRRIKIDGNSYYAHRIAWLWMSGEWPAAEVDHRDRNPGNNSWDNLRQATRIENSVNRAAHGNNVIGLKGVSFSRAGKKWRAQISVDRRVKHLGTFDTPEEAHAAYAAAAERYFGEFARAA